MEENSLLITKMPKTKTKRTKASPKKKRRGLTKVQVKNIAKLHNIKEGKTKEDTLRRLGRSAAALSTLAIVAGGYYSFYKKKPRQPELKQQQPRSKILVISNERLHDIKKQINKKSVYGYTVDIYNDYKSRNLSDYNYKIILVGHMYTGSTIADSIKHMKETYKDYKICSLYSNWEKKVDHYGYERGFNSFNTYRGKDESTYNYYGINLDRNFKNMNLSDAKNAMFIVFTKIKETKQTKLTRFQTTYRHANFISVFITDEFSANTRNFDYTINSPKLSEGYTWDDFKNWQAINPSYSVLKRGEHFEHFEAFKEAYSNPINRFNEHN